MHLTICIERAVDHFSLDDHMRENDFFTFSLSVAFISRICFIVTLVQRYFLIKFKVSTAFLFRENNSPTLCRNGYRRSFKTTLFVFSQQMRLQNFIWMTLNENAVSVCEKLSISNDYFTLLRKLYKAARPHLPCNLIGNHKQSAEQSSLME